MVVLGRLKIYSENQSITESVFYIDSDVYLHTLQKIRELLPSSLPKISGISVLPSKLC